MGCGYREPWTYGTEDRRPRGGRKASPTGLKGPADVEAVSAVRIKRMKSLILMKSCAEGLMPVGVLILLRKCED